MGTRPGLLGVAWLSTCWLQAQNGIDVPSVARSVARKLRNFVHAAGRRCLALLALGCPIRLSVLEARDGIEGPSVATGSTTRAGRRQLLASIPSCVSIRLAGWEGPGGLEVLGVLTGSVNVRTRRRAAVRQRLARLPLCASVVRTR